MKHRILGLFVLALAALSTSSVAHADTFDFSFSGIPILNSGPLFSGAGTFTATEVGLSDVYDVTGVTGSVSTGSASSSITSLIGLGQFESNDNKLIYPGILFGTKFFDFDGVSFGLANGSSVNLNNLVALNTASLEGTKGDTAAEFDTISLSKNSPVPEPNSLALFGTGILGIAGAVRLKLRFG
ncbi:PEP-CTERM sorting domain-containing protein [Granulicella sp. S190]|uniref:PEP-CTERM sorting domain-containing protein n=1 Tax=Granulicella sp. S190 TaxID=1747226 RepID=UPI00131A9D71|nr:PEP-CTERM sorting domain-containing protein [Granulicella sp. S190]